MEGKRRRLACLLLLTAALACAGAGCGAGDRAVAQVNEAQISAGELERFINLMRLCNPALDAVIEQDRESPERRRAEREFLELLVRVVLINQEAERSSLAVDETALREKTEELMRDVVDTHYGGSLEKFNRRRKQLKLLLEDLALFPCFELQQAAMFDCVAASITEEDLFIFVEENPEMLRQEAALYVYRFSTGDAAAARKCLEKLEGMLPADRLPREAPAGAGPVELLSQGWITRDDPFVDENVKQSLFEIFQTGKGILVESAPGYDLYWIFDCRPEAVLTFEDVREEAARRWQHLLYEDYYHTLWSKGRIEILDR